MRYSANLGFLWTDLPLPEAILAAHRAGFDAVECHWPYDVPAEKVTAALEATGLRMLGLNTRRGNLAAGENGLAALPDRQTEARVAIDEALAYADRIKAGAVHVMAGFASGLEARDCFVENLRYACDRAAPLGITILIEPLNHYDAPGYFLSTTEQAREIIESVGHDSLRLMFDCYHVQLMEGDLTNCLNRLLPLIGHIQFAGVPKRGRPDEGEVNYAHVFAHLDALGWHQPLGAEYKPNGPTQDSLDWMQKPGFSV
jgi:hydroxypyruvate isomerase